jgi:PIN domain nuclease of toxin-antitoxin system
MDILDSSALLAFIKKEKGMEQIKNLFLQAEQEKYSLSMHQINYVEFIYKCNQFYDSEKANAIVADLESPLLAIVNFMDGKLGLYCALLKSRYTLSLGDAVGLAYSKLMDGTFWTADRALSDIAKKEEIKISFIR